jgi:hypothetical protein
MGCSRENANIWWFLRNHPTHIRLILFKNSYFWHDSFGVYWNRVIGCKLHGHKNVQNAADPGEVDKMYCFACQRKVESMREQLARLCHSQWAGWMGYLFSKSIKNEDGTVTIPKWAVDRWKRQARTPYPIMSLSEKESDRKEADKFITFLERIKNEKAGKV